jgi:hypothetical protein
MSKKMMLLALSAISAALLVVPAAASAGGYTVHPGGKATSSIHGGAGYLSTVGGDTINCTTTTGSAAYNAAGTGGTMTLLFHGCNAFGFSCNSTSPAQPAGTIETTPLTFTNVLLDHNKKLGVTVTGTSGVLAHISCPFTTITVTGSILGEVENLACNAPTTKTINLAFRSNPHGVPQYTKVTETNAAEQLTSTKNGTPSAAAMNTTGTATFAEAIGPTC